MGKALVRIKPICRKCGSDDVQGDAYVAWDVDLQDWTVSAVMDGGTVCEVCGGETKLKWVRCVDGEEVET